MNGGDQDQNESQPLSEISVTPALVSALVDLRTPPAAADIVQFFASVMEESDRALPIVCFAYIENELKTLLKSALPQQLHVEQLLSANGPLGSAGAQATLAHALGWIDDDTDHDLSVLRKIRNYFAHSFVRDRLVDQRVISWLASHRKLQAWGPTDLLIGDTPRGRYLFAAALTAWHVMGQLHALPIVSRFFGLVDPDLIIQRDAPNRPRSLRALDDAVAKVIFLIGYAQGDGEWVVQEMTAAGFLLVDPGPDASDFLRRVADGTLEFDGPDWFRTESGVVNEEE